jgi:DNA replication protein DnaC
MLDDIFTTLARRSAALAVPEEGDFLRDGLLHCGKCGKPKMCRVMLRGDTQEPEVVGCCCDCTNEAYLRGKEEREREEKRLRIEALRADGIRDKSLTACRFDASEMTDGLLKCRRYAEHWKEMQEQNSGLLLWGNTSTGKTYAAACIANYLIDCGTPAMVTSFPRILNAGWDKQEIIDQMHYYPLVVIDDLDVERSTEYAMETVYMVIDERYKAKKPLIVTTNLTLEELCKPKNMDYRRIYERILELCVPVAFKGESFRQKAANEKMRRMKEILEGGA